MTTPDDKRRKSPVDRFRRILSAEQKPEETGAARKSPVNTLPPTINLPKAGPQVDHPTMQMSAPKPPPVDNSSSGNNRFLPAFWTIASIVSLSVNAILIILVVSLLRGLGSIDTASLGAGLVGGLYTNFERMDQAHIKATIPVQTSIPLNMTVPVQTTTGITLAKDVTIPGAHVKITTALFNIDAPASVTLPAGTSLDVAMNFNLPVQADVPVTLNVPVDIALHDTDLHPAIAGFQDTLRPLYCMINPSGLSLSGGPVCK